MVMGVPSAWSQVEAALRKIWGYETFRPPQDTVIRALLEQRDLLAVMPTGENFSPYSYIYEVNNNK